MNLLDMPNEIHRTIRTYGYNPFVSDAELYQMIINLGYNYSLMSIYDSLVKWKYETEIFKSWHQFNTYIKDEQVVSVTDGTISPSGYLGNFRHLVSFLGTLQANPINPSEVYKEGTILKYYHYSPKTRPTIVDYDAKLVSLIKEIYPSYSLQMEYDQLLMRKNYSDKLRTDYSNLLLTLDEELIEIRLDLEDNTTTLIFDDYLGDVSDLLIDDPIEYDDDYERIGYKLKEKSMDLYYQMIAFLSPRLSIKHDTDIRYPTHQLPFQYKPDF